jgi:hypothetical protein
MSAGDILYILGTWANIAAFAWLGWSAGKRRGRRETLEALDHAWEQTLRDRKQTP